MKKELKHKTVKVSWNGQEADIDEKLAPLILELWKREISTFLSCQENRPGVVWILFATAMDAEIFCNIVADEFDGDDLNSLYQRVRSESDIKGSWEYNLSLDDMNAFYDIDEKENTAEELSTGAPRFLFSVSIRFPKKDLKAVYKKIKAAPEDHDELWDRYVTGNSNELEEDEEKDLGSNVVRIDKYKLN